MTRLNIVSECYADTRLVEILTQTQKCNHQANKGQVANALKNRLANLIAIGVVDEDKKKESSSKYFSEFHLIKEQSGLRLLKHTNRLHYLIMICPELEHWLLLAAEDVKLNLADYELPSDMKALTAITKKITIGHNHQFTRLVNDLIKRKAAPVLQLQGWLKNFEKGTFT